MQRLFNRASIIYSVFLLFATVPSIAFMSLGYWFIVSNEIIWLAINVVTVVILIALCLAKRKDSTKVANIISQLLPLFALIYICVIGLLVNGVNGFFLTLYALFCFTSCYAISLQTNMLFKLCVLYSIILFFLVIVASFFIMTFGQIGKSTIV